jgi:hypothetical protein
MNINIIPTWPNTSTGPGYGTITPLWYNPRNPEETSPVETDSCTLNFASFCLSWEWGNLMSDYIALSPGMDNRNLYCNFGSPLFCPWCGNGSSSQQLNAPLIVQWHSSQQIFENFQTDYTRTYGMNSSHLQSPFNYQLQVTVQPYSSGAVYVYDQVGTPVGVDHCLQGGSISLFSSYTCNATFAPAPSVQASEFRIGSLLADCHTYCGLNCSSRPCYLSSGDAITGSYTNGSGYGFGSPYQNFSGHLTPSYQYWFNIYHSDNPTNLNVNIRINAQEVFLGYSGY